MTSGVHCRFPRMALFWSVAIVVLFLSASPFARAKASSAELQKEYGDKVLTLRQPYEGGHLHFEAGGKISSASRTGPWTIYGQVRVKNISLHGDFVQLQVERVVLFYDGEIKQLRDVQSVSKGDKSSKLFDLKSISSKKKATIEVLCGVPEPEMADVEKAMSAVFLASGEPLANAVPDYWKGWVSGSIAETPRGTVTLRSSCGKNGEALPEEQVTVHRAVEPGMKPPHVKYAPDPEYSDLAREARYQGICKLQLTLDRNGSPRNVSIVRTLGLGLDENAVQVVQKWRFDPATKDGEPVAVQINLEINFRFY